MIPGPSIQVCENDRVVIDVENHMEGMEVTIHWHGIWQRGTQYYDGVPFVTQCPIQQGNTFRCVRAATSRCDEFFIWRWSEVASTIKSTSTQKIPLSLLWAMKFNCGQRPRGFRKVKNVLFSSKKIFFSRCSINGLIWSPSLSRSLSLHWRRK